MKRAALPFGTQTMRWFALLLPALGIGCGSDYETCDRRGDVQECTCGPAEGIRRCLPEHVWGACVCDEQQQSPADADAGAAGGGAGAEGTAGGASAGTGGSPAAGSSAAGEGGGGAPMSGAGGSAGAEAGSGGAGGSGSGGGQAGSAGSDKPPYGACDPSSAEEDCPDAAICIETLTLIDSYTVCAPACADADECPEPAGSFGAVLECVEGRCRLNCAPELETVSCPSGMVCAEDLLAGSYCHAGS